MPILGTINLIQTKTSENPELEKMTPVLKKASYIALIALVISGIVVGGVFSYLQLRETQLKKDEETLLVSITQNSAKEGLLVSIKERAAVVDKILGSQRNIADLFTLVSEIVPTSNLMSLSLADTGHVTITAAVGSIPEAIGIVDSVLTLGEEGKLSKAALTSFGLSGETGLEISLSFVPML